MEQAMEAYSGHSRQVIVLRANQIGQRRQVLVDRTENAGVVKLYFLRLSRPEVLDMTGDRTYSWSNDEQHETGQATKDRT
jgi:hypothetical protein